MSEFKILNDISESIYFTQEMDGYYNEYDPNDPYHDAEFEHIGDAQLQFYFSQELQKQSDVKKQSGYSQKRNCNFISLVLITSSSGDGEFLGYSCCSTCLTERNNTIEDSNRIEENGGEVGYSIHHAYHHLPDGKIIEFSLTNGYENELNSIYQAVKKIRYYYELDKSLPQKTNVKKSSKI